MLTLRNKFNAQQEKTETHTLNDKYENFIDAHLKEAAECIPTKQRAKHRVSWEILAVKKKVGRHENCFQMQQEEPNQYQCPET